MPGEAVVLVHGIWVNGADMGLLRRRLARAGFRPLQFRYSGTRCAPRVNAMKLHAFVDALGESALHFVGHSLGGLVIRHLFHDHPDQPPGRVVTLGTPHRSSRAAATISRLSFGRFMLGESVREGLLGNAPPWPPARELGSIAGTLRLGMGMVIPGIPAPSDGTVAVEETRLTGMRDHLTVPVSHFGMLLSARVAEEIAHFLRHGSFRAGPVFSSGTQC